MKNHQLLSAIGQIEDRYILEAAPGAVAPQSKQDPRKTAKIIPFLRKPAAVAAALALFVCISGITVSAAAGDLEGFFQDVLGWNRAVIGTTFAQATDEVRVTAAKTEDALLVELTMVFPEKAPYREFQQFGIASYAILDEGGQTAAEGTALVTAAVTEGTARVSIPLDTLPEGSYKLTITGLVGEKKGDQPLILEGNWEWGFTN